MNQIRILKMRLLKSKTGNKKIILEINKIHYIKSMTPHKDILEGEELINPIEVRQHHYSLTPRKGVNGIAYAEKRMMEHQEKALQLIEGFPASKAKESLIKLADYIISRTK